MEVLVSIVIPIYNVDAYLDRCIESVVGQSYENLEIILVDDGSTDRSPQICDDWADKDRRIKVVHKTNAGLGMARNSGIDIAEGKYIFFFDSDDYVDSTIVRKCVINAEENASEVVIFGRYDVYEDGNIKKGELKAGRAVFKKEHVINELLPGMFTYDMGFGVSAWGKMYDLGVIKTHGLRFYSEREIISEDSYFALQLFTKVSTVTVIDDNLYYYCKRKGSLSRAYNDKRQQQNDLFLKRSLEYAESEDMPPRLLYHIMARYQMFSVAAMKQVLSADMPRKERLIKLKEIFDSEALNKTLNLNVLKLHKPKLTVFFSLLKIRQYWLCRRILEYKIR